MKRGLTLIEMLVAVLLCGIVVFVAIQMVTGEHKNYTVTRKKVRLQSDAREAMRILDEEIKNAGYRVRPVIDASLNLQVSKCPDALYPSNASIDPNPSSSAYTAGFKALEIRFYNPIDPPTSSNYCKSKLWTVGYMYNSTDHILYRQGKQGDPTVPATALNATDWAPFLENVMDFSWEYGVLMTNDPLLASAGTGSQVISFTGTSDWYSLNTTASTPAGSNVIGKPWTVSTRKGGTDVITAVYSAIPLTASGNTSDGARNENLDENATYRVSFDVAANDAFFDATKGIAANAYLNAGFYTQTGVATGTSGNNVFTFKPASGAIINVQYDLVPTAQSGKVFFGVSFQLQAADVVDRTLTISNLKVVRIDKGNYAFQTTAPALATVQALKLKMTVLSTAQSSTETVKLERVIPVVNNGL